MAKLKVYGGATYCAQKTLRTIVAVTNQKEAAKLLGMSLYEFRNYWAQTFNANELKAALAEPGVVLIELPDGTFKRG